MHVLFSTRGDGGGSIAMQIDPAKRYSVLKVGERLFAYSDRALYITALGVAWDLGFVPDWVGAALGADLPDLVSRLDGVDLDISDYTPADLKRSGGRFSRG